ncbi:PucR family transcriptional regulator [Pseudonocardia thermophila]|uniref:PucR family transcriptional regulator n=1 Tax=Pseudonocardia thermophila TaxID=1848 RepID=UPI00248F335B|nr:PucR family transcriptional regulator [Pseudonocardia thermophila]
MDASDPAGVPEEPARAVAVHEELVRAVVAGDGPAPVAQALAAHLGCGVRIVDEHGDDRAAAGDAEQLKEIAGLPDVRAAVERSWTTGHATVVDAPAGRVVVAALAVGRYLFGAVLADCREAVLGAADVRTVERAAHVAALLVLAEEAVTETDQRRRADLVTDLVTDGAGRPGVGEEVRRLGFDPQQLQGLAVIAVGGDRRAEAARVIARAVGASGLVGAHADLVVVLAEQARGPAVEDVRRAAADAVGGPVLAVRAPSGTDPLPRRFDAARRAVRLLDALGVHDGTVPADEVLPYAAVLDADRRSLAAFLEATIGPVLRYDAERGAELLTTLRAFVRTGASPTRTARALFLHPNTVLQRLDRLDRVLGVGWRDDERLFRISLAVRLHELAERLGQPG